ncbi:MAG: hypothetical protein HZA50_01940 [Planctomycetes bacterium]|nr:hypothetical protein [Planctomycetota bacterium]
MVVKPLALRENDLDLSAIVDLGRSDPPAGLVRNFQRVGELAVRARKAGASIIMMMGAHVIRSGVQRYIIDLMERGYISCIALNGAGMIHDYEFALIGATTESVARYVRTGEFGLWRETGLLNEIAVKAFRADKKAGLGRAVGEKIVKGRFSHADISLLATAWRLGIPATVHVAFGQDILHEHPNFDPVATGALTYNDFLTYTSAVSGLENGLVMNFGSAVMAPEVFLKAITMCRNVAVRRGRMIGKFATVVCDLRPLPADITAQPSKKHPDYYYRPWKTMLIRTVADGGKSFYFQAGHAQTVPAFWQAINNAERKK